MKILVCGGRDYSSADTWNILEHSVAPEFPSWPPTMIIQGGAKGADEGAKEWAKGSGIKCLEFKADWKTHGKSAGPIRNRKMIEQGKPDFVLAFPGGRGTANMIRQAREFNIPVVEIN